METTSTALVVAPSDALAVAWPKIHPNGSWVKMTGFDPYGFNGRERHPSEADVGFFGQVVKASVTLCDDDFVMLSHDEDAPDGTELVGEMSFVCYLVRAPSGRLLDLMGHEVELMNMGATVEPA